MIAGIVAVVAAIAAFFGIRALVGGGADVQGTVDECSIAADGALTASGTVESGDALNTTVEVRFEDLATGTEVDRDTVEVRGDAGESVAWSASGQAGDGVERVTCVLGPID